MRMSVFVVVTAWCQRESFAIRDDHDHNRIQPGGGDDVERKLNQCVAAFHVLAFFHQRVESIALQPDGVDADVENQLNPCIR